MTFETTNHVREEQERPIFDGSDCAISGQHEQRPVYLPTMGVNFYHCCGSTDVADARRDYNNMIRAEFGLE